MQNPNDKNRPGREPSTSDFGGTIGPNEPSGPAKDIDE